MNIIVVGSGIAGLIAALELAPAHQVTLVTKSQLSEANTRYAQGGIAAVMHADDNVAEHIDDTLRAGAGLCRPEAVEILCAEGPDRIRDLIRIGVNFDQHNGELAQGREAAHSRARVLHAGGDATGLAIETALVHTVRGTPNIHILEHTFAADLELSRSHSPASPPAQQPWMTTHDSSKGSDHVTAAVNASNSTRVIGLHVISQDGTPALLPADAVLLASGGAGHLYPYTTNPAVATGDGVALALRAGARVADLEFYQFHPTALSAEGGFLISEAVRGDGAVLRDLHGHRFMQDIHPDAELAPRDVVARGIAAQMARQNNQPVLLDATHLGATFLRTRFPTINAACERAGLDWANEPIPVAPAAHYWMGGVETDTWGRTSLPGLFAAGEAACTGVHGANRLASNSLLESIVFAHRAARLLRDDPTTALSGSPSHPVATDPGDTEREILLPRESPQGHHLDAPSQPALTTTASGSGEEPHQRADDANSTSPTATSKPPFTRTDLQQLMWKAAGISRTASELSAAHVQLRGWLSSTKPPESIYDRETANLLQLADALVTAALARCESRGAHFRLDFPEALASQRHHIALALSEVPPA